MKIVPNLMLGMNPAMVLWNFIRRVSFLERRIKSDQSAVQLVKLFLKRSDALQNESSQSRTGIGGWAGSDFALSTN